MTDVIEGACGVCEKPLAKATRVHDGVRYCSTCYARSFKRLLCGGCGMFKRLLASESDPRCQACIAAQPCARCKRVGRPIGKITPYGPVCNACRHYFVDPQACEVCGQLSTRLTRQTAEKSAKQVCPKCARAGLHSCTSCGRHRPCELSPDGAWRCKLCATLGEVACSICSMLMPAGLGKRCHACYWRDRCERSALQLVELMVSRRVRTAFTDFVAWLVQQGSVQRATLRLPKHSEFFVALDQAGDDAWTDEFLLKHFGSAKLRQYELPVRWLGQYAGVTLSAKDKSRAADLRRVNLATMHVPQNTLARAVIESFRIELMRRHDAGELTARSMRLALRPAITLLMVEDVQGSRLPGQAALDQYLRDVPGQRAAVSTFLGFLKTNHGIELQLPPKRQPGSIAMRQALEKQIAALIRASGDVAQLSKRWLPLALRYFHHLSATEARQVYAQASRSHDVEGMILTYQGKSYWLPLQPMELNTRERK